MPNIVTPYGINIDQHKKLIDQYSCDKCGGNKLRPISFVQGANTSAFCYECMECHKNDFFVYTKKPLSTPDVIINITNSVGELDKQIQDEPSGATCSKCGNGKLHSIDTSKCHRMALDIVECDSCQFLVPIISIVRDTLIAYSYNLQLAKKVEKNFPEIALVFCVSAIETYFRQLFKYRGDLHEYLIKKRKINFQNLQETKEIISKEFNINIVKLIEKDWQFLSESSIKRHFIIHHASYNDSGEKIEISNDDITKLISIVDKLVFEMELELFNRGVVI